MNYRNWQDDLKESIVSVDSIKDEILSRLIKGELISCEDSEAGKIGQLLDINCGIDLIRILDSNIQGIASRVQWGRAWDTFTVRLKRNTGTATEFEKRIKQIEQGCFYPYYTMQCYFDSKERGKCLSVGICKTVGLYRFIQEYPSKVIERKSDNDFYVVPWGAMNELSDIDFKVKIYTAP